MYPITTGYCYLLYLQLGMLTLPVSGHMVVTNSEVSAVTVAYFWLETQTEFGNILPSFNVTLGIFVVREILYSINHCNMWPCFHWVQYLSWIVAGMIARDSSFGSRICCGNIAGSCSVSILYVGRWVVETHLVGHGLLPTFSSTPFITFVFQQTALPSLLICSVLVYLLQ